MNKIVQGPPELPSGWERDLAAPVLREVEVSRTFLSDDTHTIGLPPRTTQPSVGRYVREIRCHRDASAGTHYGLYSGVNLLPVFGERLKNVPTVPRTHHHFGSGVNPSYQAAKLHPSVVSMRLLATRAQWVPVPSEAALTISEMTKFRQHPRKHVSEHEAVFPFPKSLASRKSKVGLTAQNYEPCKEGETTTVAKTSLQDEVPVHDDALLWETPFWYDGPLDRLGGPLGDLNDYGFTRFHEDGHPSTVTSAVEVDNPGFYIPGQMATENKTADLVTKDFPPEPITATKVCSGEREPLYKKRVVHYRPPYEHYQLNPWIGQDKENLAKVGISYKSDECRKHYSQWPPGPQPFVLLRRCDYPDIRLSVL